ncbi:MAG: L-histidine N(alpha)-methyltransferase [Wenzhouxiangella sp.]
MIEQFRADVLAGLAAPQKAIPCKYLYDERGSELFDRICRTDDYYVTRADLALHENSLPEIARRIGTGAHIIEFGSGTGLKTRRLLASLHEPRAYTPIEISTAALEASVTDLGRAFPDLDIHPVQADYTRQIDERLFELDPPAARRVVYFPGSTIGNFDRNEAIGFLERMGRIAGRGGAILIGVDLLKSRDRLQAAYDDSEGITAEFNRNLLIRLERELGAQVDPDVFRHEARFDRDRGRVEMHLVAKRSTAIVLDGRRFELLPGESIHTENSYKYSLEGFRDLAVRAGLRAEAHWTDPENLFSMHWLRQDQA